MDNKTKKMIAKARSFVMRLTESDIKNILKICNFELNTHIVDDLGYQIPAISKFYDKEKDEFVIELKCINKQDDLDKMVKNAFYSLASKIPYINSSNYFSVDGVTIVWLRDFYISELALLPDDEKLSEHQKSYAQYMYKLFGEYYRKEYNKNIRKNIKNNENDKTKGD